uniref:Uncharacterized protein n=1 Tax=Plectus sambesii TaxID=2011161 RepID=A0A914W3J6_9BILA
MSPLSVKARFRIFRTTLATLMLHAVGLRPSSVVKDGQKKVLVDLVTKYGRLSRERDYRFMVCCPYRISAWIEVAWVLNCTVEAAIRSWQEIVQNIQHRLTDDELSMQILLAKILFGKRSRKRTVSSLLAHSIVSQDDTDSWSSSDSFSDSDPISSLRFTSEGASLNIKRSLSLELELIDVDLKYIANNLLKDEEQEETVNSL